MSMTVSQDILDALTDITLPGTMRAASCRETLAIGTARLPLYCSQAVILGSGAAGLRAAVEMKRRGIDVIVVTSSLFGGTSACSGSDKQTLHTISTTGHGDDFIAMADALSAGGAMDADIAYIESVGSIEAMAGLQYLGLPLPQDRFGAVLRYQTDHDEAGRATSCGPRTSRLMVRVLAEEAVRLNIPVVNHTTALRILKDEEGGQLTGLLAIRPKARSDDNPLGLVVFSCPFVVLAAGGPGELYRDSVYPRQCFGALGLALEAGIDTVNLTENQFGIGTRREGFPWNLSGTYVQAMPFIYALDADGKEHNFLADYYRTTQELASNIFRKGYQWPFHATRMLDHGSSLIDLAIFRQTRAGRNVCMDFTRNPLPIPGERPFSLERLDDDVLTYLKNNDALCARPIDRLLRMNPLSIELYRRYGHDLAHDPLPFDVNHQHMNGGIAVDPWARTSLAGCYAIGEAAGTHGVTRPGGAALNAGQVFALRCARHVQARLARDSCKASPPPVTSIADEMAWLMAGLDRTDGLLIADVRDEVQARMSDHAGFICPIEDVPEALQAARDLNARIRARGLRIPEARLLPLAVLWRQMALSSEAVLHALNHFIAHGGGSRGARALCSKNGRAVPQARSGPLDDYRFIPEQDSVKKQQIHVRWDDGRFVIETRRLRDRDDPSSISFEKNWPASLNGDIYTQ